VFAAAENQDSSVMWIGHSWRGGVEWGKWPQVAL